MSHGRVRLDLKVTGPGHLRSRHRPRHKPDMCVSNDGVEFRVWTLKTNLKSAINPAQFSLFLRQKRWINSLISDSKWPFIFF
ncbi:hypothetical protein L596_025285 [Steinernema carpocapsae]|uniref:Uncharacterized protein n=1 Tax=Steinernema carpocapsae TaxID=34508 RepID=A0A4U5M7C9_STECR|nr:hypothetical protein L596_025285 [Steinernema carpocapsae]